MENKVPAIKAMVVDDAAFMRKALVDILSSDGEIEVVGVARHGKEALDVLDRIDPDVITLDVDMPVMDGLTTIKHIMIRNPRPVVMVSALAHQGRVTLEALRLGAVDFFPKPSGTVSYDIHDQARRLNRLVKQAAKVNPRAIKRALAPARLPARSRACERPPMGIVAVVADIGASSSLIRMLANINPVLPISFMVCQGLSGTALESYAMELDMVLPWDVRSDGNPSLFQGTCLLAELGTPWCLRSKGGGEVEAVAAPGGDMDQMLKDVARLFGERSAAVVLGGNSVQGLRGLQAVKDAGGLSLVLDPRATACDLTARMAMEAEVAMPVTEHAMWMEIEAFGRKVALKGAGQGAEP